MAKIIRAFSLPQREKREEKGQKGQVKDKSWKPTSYAFDSTWTYSSTIIHWGNLNVFGSHQQKLCCFIEDLKAQSSFVPAGSSAGLYHNTCLAFTQGLDICMFLSTWAYRYLQYLINLFHLNLGKYRIITSAHGLPYGAGSTKELKLVERGIHTEEIWRSWSSQMLMDKEVPGINYSKIDTALI